MFIYPTGGQVSLEPSISCDEPEMTVGVTLFRGLEEDVVIILGLEIAKHLVKSISLATQAVENGEYI